MPPSFVRRYYSDSLISDLMILPMENGLHLTLVALKRKWHDIKIGKRSLPTTINSERIPTPSLHGEFKTVF